MDGERTTGEAERCGAVRRHRILRRSALVVMGGGISISLLFWAKLRVVTNIPRTTYAEPLETIPADTGTAKDEGEEPDKGDPSDEIDRAD